MSDKGGQPSLVDRAFSLFSKSVKFILMMFGLVIVASIIIASVAINRASEEIAKPDGGSVEAAAPTAAYLPKVPAQIIKATVKGQGFMSYLELGFSFKNDYQKKITALKGDVTFYDSFNKKLDTVGFTEYNLSINPGAVGQSTLSKDFNQFMSSDNQIESAAKGNQLKFTVVVTSVVFEDGTTEGTPS